MCVSMRAPTPPPMPEPAPIQAPPPVVKNTQASPKPAGYSAEDGRDRSSASSYDKKRVGASSLRIPIIGGL
jgi:hypothetical protein